MGTKLFKKWIRFIVTRGLMLIPKQVRHQMFRNMVNVPDFCESKDFVVKVAETRQELEQAFGLLHDCYVGQGLMHPHDSNLRCNAFTLLPETTTIVVMYKNEVVGTVALIKDSPLGIPSDKEFSSENHDLRRSQRRLIEVSAFAVKKSFRQKGHAVSLMLMKYLYNYSQLMDGNCLVCTVHPRAQDFYEALWLFKRRGPVVKYEMVNKAAAVHMHLDLNEEMKEKCILSYASDQLQRNLARWVLAVDTKYLYPVHRFGQVLDPVFNPQLLEYFFVRKTDVFSTLSDRERRIFAEIYQHFFGLEAIQDLALPNHGLREFRVPVSTSAGVSAGEHRIVTKVMNLTAEGAFISFQDIEGFKSGDKVFLSFKLGERNFKVSGHLTWMNVGQTPHLPLGFGVKFGSRQNDLVNELKGFTYSRPKALPA